MPSLPLQIMGDAYEYQYYFVAPEEPHFYASLLETLSVTG